MDSPGGVNYRVYRVYHDTWIYTGCAWIYRQIQGVPGYMDNIQGVPGYMDNIQGVPGYMDNIQGVPGYMDNIQGVPGYIYIMVQNTFGFEIYVQGIYQRNYERVILKCCAYF